MGLTNIETALSAPVLPKSFRVEILNAFEKHICVTARMTAEMEVMKISLNVKLKLRPVRADNLDAKVDNALHMNACVINKSIAMTAVTNRHIVMLMNALKLK